jgi:hypothetical protein
VNSCVNSPEDGPVGPKHVDIRRYMNKIEIVTSVGFSFHIFISQFVCILFILQVCTVYYISIYFEVVFVNL